MSINAKRISLILGGILFTLSLILAGTWFARIAVVQTIAEMALRAQGFDNSRLNIKAVDLQAVVIKDISLGAVINAENITVTYDPLNLIRGIVDTVTVKDLVVDITDPSGPVFAQLRTLVDGGAQTSDNSVVNLPKISVTHFKIIESQIERSARIEGKAALSTNGDIQLDANATLRLKTPNGNIALKDAALHASGSIQSNEFNIRLNDALLQQDGDNPQFAPLFIKAEGEVAGRTAKAIVNVRSAADVELINLQGEFDIEKQVGNVSYKIENLVFDQDALQPAHLLPSLTNLPVITAALSGQGQVILKGDTLNLSTATTLGNVHIQDKDYSLSTPKITNKTTLQISHLRDLSQFEGVTKIANLSAIAANENIGVRDFVFSVTGKDENDLKASLESIVEPRAETKIFPQVKLHVAAVKLSDIIDIEGYVEGFSKKLNIQFNAEHNLNSKLGSADMKIPMFKIGGKNTKPSQISSYLKDFDANMAVDVSSNITAKWDADFNPVVKVTGDFKNTSYRSAGLSISNASAEIETSEFTLNDPISTQIKNLSARIDAEGRQFDLSALISSVKLRKNYTGADITASAITVKPMAGAVIKPDIVLGLQGDTDFQDIQMNLQAKSKLLGSFLNAIGSYNINRRQGDVAIETAKIPFDPDGLTLADLLQNPPEDIELRGAVGAKLKLIIQDDAFDGTGRLEIDRLTIEQDGTRLEALDGNIELQGLNPLKTAPRQRLHADGINAGIEIGSPSLEFSIDHVNNTPIFKIHRMLMNLFGGAAEIKDEVIDPFAKSNRLKVHLTSLSMEELVALGDLEEVVASGSLRGIIPLEFDGEKLIIPDAILEAEGPGLLSVKSQAARQALASGGSQTKLLFDILENFNYSALSLKIKKPASGDDVVTLHTKGANPDVENNRPVVLNVNLSTNLDRIFNTILDGYRLSEKALRATLKGRK